MALQLFASTLPANASFCRITTTNHVYQYYGDRQEELAQEHMAKLYVKKYGNSLAYQDAAQRRQELLLQQQQKQEAEGSNRRRRRLRRPNRNKGRHVDHDESARDDDGVLVRSRDNHGACLGCDCLFPLAAALMISGDDDDDDNGDHLDGRMKNERLLPARAHGEHDEETKKEEALYHDKDNEDLAVNTGAGGLFECLGLD